jgi:hypothetical protein
MSNVFLKGWNFSFGEDLSEFRFFLAGRIKSGISEGTFLGGFCVFKESILNSKNPIAGPLDSSKGPAWEFGLFQES